MGRRVDSTGAYGHHPPVIPPVRAAPDAAAPATLATAVRRPGGYLLSAWPWRASACLMGGVLIGGLAVLLAPLLVLATLLPTSRHRTWRGLLLVDAQRVRLVDPSAASLLVRVVNAEADRRGLLTWSRVTYLVLLALVLGPVSLLVILVAPLLGATAFGALLLSRTVDVQILGWYVDTPLDTVLVVVLGVGAFLAAALGAGVLALAHRALAVRLVIGDADLRAEVKRLNDSRERLLSAIETERQRIAGELHDRVQHRLAALSMRLGMAASTGEESTRVLACASRDEIEEVLRGLRAVVRGIAPQALTDHGLPGAVADLASDFPVAVEVDIRLSRRLPAQVEHTAYLVVSEAMTNAAKHSGCGRMRISCTDTEHELRLTVADDGCGGAAATGDGGLTGLDSRVDALGGTLAVSSPTGGPTKVTMRCPLP